MSSTAQKRAGFLFCDVPKEKKDERRSDSTYASARSAPASDPGQHAGLSPRPAALSTHHAAVWTLGDDSPGESSSIEGDRYLKERKTMNMYLAMERELLVVHQQQGKWQTEAHLVGMQPTCVAVDPLRPERVYCGTFGRGLWRSSDAGRNWEPIGDAGATTKPWNGLAAACACLPGRIPYVPTSMGVPDGSARALRCHEYLPTAADALCHRGPHAVGRQAQAVCYRINLLKSSSAMMSRTRAWT